MGNKTKNELNSFLGQKFGRLTVIEFTGQSTVGKQKRRIIKCICDCGNEKLIPLTYLRRGHTKSCGCLQLENATINLLTAHKKLFEGGVWESDPKMASAKKAWRLSYNDEDISFEDFLVLSQQNCFYCNKFPSNCCSAYGDRNSKFRQENGDFIYNGLDRIDNTKGHLKNNVVPCCIDCNTAKLDRTQTEFFDWIKIIYDKHLA